MNTNGSAFKDADALAAQYDEAAKKYGWSAPEVLFSLVSDRIVAGECLLDLGIGTGLSAVPFKKAGLHVYGVDGSLGMLAQCASRGVAINLKEHDILSMPLPYADNQFDHICACGVFHLVALFDDIFAEAGRMVRGSGTFMFTTEELKPGRAKGERLNDCGVLGVKNEKSGVTSYLHSHDLVERLLRSNRFAITKTLDFVAYGKTDWADERTFRAYIAVKSERP
jgi:predicted TPR repeat methyltransferase